MKAATARKLEKTSWLAQTIADKKEIEFNTKGATPRYSCLQTLYTIVTEADRNNENIRYENSNGARGIIISNIPSLAIEYGIDFNQEGMEGKIRGLAERYKDGDGNYIVIVKTTHDMNSAIITGISELLYQMGTH